jgi:hypothetical protein
MKEMGLVLLFTSDRIDIDLIVMRDGFDHDILMRDTDRFSGRQGLVDRTFVSLFLAETHTAPENFVTGFALDIIEVQTVFSQECIVGAYNFEVPGKYNYCFPVA